MVPLGIQDNGWACDGILEEGECLSGLTGFDQSQGMRRFQCTLCRRFDYCEKCFERGLARKPCSRTCQGTAGADGRQEGLGLSCRAFPAFRSFGSGCIRRCQGEMCGDLQEPAQTPAAEPCPDIQLISDSSFVGALSQGSSSISLAKPPTPWFNIHKKLNVPNLTDPQRRNRWKSEPSKEKRQD